MFSHFCALTLIQPQFEAAASYQWFFIQVCTLSSATTDAKLTTTSRYGHYHTSPANRACFNVFSNNFQCWKVYKENSGQGKDDRDFLAATCPTPGIPRRVNKTLPIYFSTLKKMKLWSFRLSRAGVQDPHYQGRRWRAHTLRGRIRTVEKGQSRSSQQERRRRKGETSGTFFKHPHQGYWK